MDAAKGLTSTYLQRVPRWCSGKDPAAKPQRQRSRSPPHSWQITHIQNQRVISAARQCRRSERAKAPHET
ncbi:hypothetical protein C9397_01635 [Xanthomonas vasicola pv. vasculorum]|uniref:Uncharacterized protein n=2 Tax=Xanthomonas vasicola TaxID=56459 RepID=A0ABD7S4N0_XANVA|nr:hypothetical protein C7V42_17385 [Xanthomonas vasicola pv. vasculorum]AZR23869.1 hypothetical protein NX81_018005 [Xanthomonas vasicola]AZR25736.1 hypothetical protein NX80_003685 [Xanthomonas vasicola pv. arecae]AZR32266.1 hypothetical protein KWO_018955 [Xanthomonas vasicola pv. musacearum NCPPB 4379]RRJ44130.1 hypothetical protein EIM46_02350 [Xanthomonas vasicola pv. musacearum]